MLREREKAEGLVRVAPCYPSSHYGRWRVRETGGAKETCYNNGGTPQHSEIDQLIDLERLD